MSLIYNCSPCTKSKRHRGHHWNEVWKGELVNFIHMSFGGFKSANFFVATVLFVDLFFTSHVVLVYICIL